MANANVDHCYQGDCRSVMRALIAAGVRVQCIVTSPPYWGLRDYGVDGQLGLEGTLREFLDNMVEVFDLCRKLLADDGTLWLNMGDSYAGSRAGPETGSLRGTRHNQAEASKAMTASRRRDDAPIPRSDVRVEGLKPKDLVGQPWRLAFALQDAGWWLRQDIIWHKPNPMPESVRDRCTKAHEYLFLMTKSERYFFDQDAIRTPYSAETKAQSFDTMEYKRRDRYKAPDGWNTGPGAHGPFHPAGREKGKAASGDYEPKAGANRRSVWTISTQAYAAAHFATFPEALVEPCILAGSRPGDIVFDPFMGSGTVASVAQRLGRRWIGAELNPDYIALQTERTRQPGLELTAA
ncbi:site-specific DNA-methyltransferase [Cupriavidus gilardii]|uniref:DNA-methyltransferase n=1 Tax=Cupriavidus gilardii TaxID=82541 RepID=UPI001ABE6C95|nr:site-specific DNA-methyltransferase [Cupriavidus gilardii]MBO4119889.1 site-specific DNA-methyltransferase [Cupriavidus gilardii]